MASHNERPTLDLRAGRRVFEEDLQHALNLHSAEAPADLGWRVHGPRSLLVPIIGTHADTVDQYLLRLEFLTGREWPPSAQFVNPDTLKYIVGQDTGHLPQLGHPEVHVHPAYVSPTTSTAIQLICCSATFEYYDVKHGGEETTLWQSSDNFLVTLAAIRRAVGTPHYQGRYPADVG